MNSGNRCTSGWLWIAVVVVSLLASACLPAAASADWPLYGHDLANTRSAGADGPTPAAARTLRPFWSFTSPQGDFTGTPVVSGGSVVAGSSSGVVYAIDADSGRLLWSQTVGGHINGSAAIAGGKVFVPVNIDESTGAGTPSVVALELSTGARLWQTTLDRQPGADVFASPVVVDGRVYIGLAAGYAEGVFPAVHDRGSMVALSASTGALIWKTYTVPAGYDGGAVWSTPAVDASTGLLYIGTGNAYHSPAADTTDAILALNARAGTIVAEFQATAGDVSQGESGRDADIGASPNLFTSSTGQPLVGEGDKAGNYWALDRSTLARVWTVNVGGTSDVGGILGSTAWDGKAIYGPETLQNETWSLSANGARRWTITGSDDSHLGSVAVANGVVYSTDYTGHLSARSTATGALLAQLPLAAPSWGGVSISGGTVFAAVGTRGAPGLVEAFRPFAPPCSSREIRATYSLVFGSSGAGQVAYELTVANHSQRESCTFNGPLTATLRDRRGRPLPTNAGTAPAGTYSIMLAPGQWAQAQSRFSADVAGPGEPGRRCEQTAYSLRLTVGNGTTIAPMDPTPVCSHGRISFDRLQVVAPTAACNARQLSARFKRIGMSGHDRVDYTLALRNTGAFPCYTSSTLGLQLLGSRARKLRTHVLASVGSPYILPPDTRELELAVLSITPGPGEPHTGSCEPLASRLEVIPRPGTGAQLAPISPPVRVCHGGSISLSGLYPAG